MRFLLGLILIFFITSCTDAGCSKIGNYGGSAQVTCYSGGRLIYTGFSTGKVQSESTSDGYYFKDAKTNELVEVSGDCKIEYQ